jgi:hypothetical protein
MDAQHHAILSNYDTTKRIEHEAALRQWQSGPFAAWQTAAQRAAKQRAPVPDRPTMLEAPEPIQPAVCSAAAEHGVSVDDLVRHVRKMEVRTVYRDGQLAAAAASLSDRVAAAVMELDWPPLPELHAAPAGKALPDFHPTVRQTAPDSPPARETDEEKKLRHRAAIDRHLRRTPQKDEP